MDLTKIYQYRFSGVKKTYKDQTWNAISKFIYNKLGHPKVILDPAAGACEFLNNLPEIEKWGVDLNIDFLNANANNDIHKIIGNCLEISLPDNYFDSVFVSNFLEHLETNCQLKKFLTKMYGALKPGGNIAIMGPNFKYSYKNYFDYADHSIILTEKGLAEHLIGTGYNIVEVIGRFIPFSFQSRLPKNKTLVDLYLKIPFAWRILGKQFLVIASK